ncbi:MAG: hypothetical protein WBA10_05705 [Elainellaceae cyanobacterium]
MENLSPKAQAQLQEHLEAAARILYAHTEPEKLQDFESIEWEVRSQLLQEVAPRIGEFFSQQEGNTGVVNNGK